MVWRKGSFSLTDEFQGDNFLGVAGLWGENQVQVSVVNVYVPYNLRGKRRLWEEILNQMEVGGG